MKHNIGRNTILLIVIIALYDHFVLNIAEKMFCEVYFDIAKRPLYKCNEKCLGVNAVGMPSGHLQSLTLILIILFHYRFISLPLCFGLIFIASLHRVLIHKNTHFQVLAGIILGCICSSIYIIQGFVKGMVLMFALTFLTILLIIYKIESEINKPIPVWVDTEMYPDIQAKRKTTFIMKFIFILSNFYLKGPTFISWKTLEDQLDILIEKLKEVPNVDLIVGIKTGGAIISDYVSKKLQLPNNKIKLSRTEYNCNKKLHHTIDVVYKKAILQDLGDYSICEGIPEDIEGKRIILIDETIDTGKTMVEAMKYLMNDKKAALVVPACISLSENKRRLDFNFIYTMHKTVNTWPWGHDN